MSIEYNYPIEQLDDLIRQIDQGITPMMTPDLQEEVRLRYHELQQDDLDEEEDEAYMSAIEKHEAAMKAMDDKRRKSHSRNVVVLELTDEEKQAIHSGCECSYIRNDPNSEYNISDEDLAASEEESRIRRRLSTISKIYYHQEDYRNAIQIIMDAIDYSLHHDYPWLTYDEAVQALSEGRIRYTYGPMPLLYIDYNTPISDPKILKGIYEGSINLIDKDAEPVKKKKVKSNPVSEPYTVIGPAEHAHYVEMHNAGFNTPISTILKSCSTIYNRYVMPSSFGWSQGQQDEALPSIDWFRPGAGEEFFNQKYHVERNPVSEITSVLNSQNPGMMNHAIGNGLRDFMRKLSPQQETTFRGISTSLQTDQKVVDLEARLMDVIRATNPNL